MKLSQDVGKMQKMLEERKPAPITASDKLLQKVKPWESKKAASPLVGKSWYQKLWVELFEPWRMRHQELP